jgi:hypothetical protein
VLVDLTRDHEQARTALLQITGQAQQAMPRDVSAAGRLPGFSAEQLSASDRACGTRLTLTTLTGLLQTLGDIDGPKSLVFVSSGLMTPTRDAPATNAPGQCELRSNSFEEVAAAASSARARFYLVQPNDEQADSAANAFANPEASRFGTADESLAGLQHLAGVTGGELFRLAARPAESVFERIVTESAAYYALRFTAEPAERNGQAHRVEIRVAREGVVVKSPPHFVIPRAESTAEMTPQRMLRTGRRFRELPLRATTYTSRMAGDSTLKIVAAAEPMDPAVPLKSAAFGLFDSRGKLTAQSSADGRELAALPLVAALPAPQGTYMLRVAAVDANGRRGTVDYPFRAELTPASGQPSLRVSGLVLGVQGGDGFRPRLQFGTEPAAAALFEIYGNAPRSAEITARVEIATDADAPPLAGAPAALRPGTEEDSQTIVGVIPIASLAPGDYVARAILLVDGRPAARVTRTLRKVR